MLSAMMRHEGPLWRAFDTRTGDWLGWVPAHTERSALDMALRVWYNPGDARTCCYVVRVEGT